MLRINFHSIIILAIAVLGSCNSLPTASDKQNFYRDVFERLIMEHYYDHCIIVTEALERRSDQLLNQGEPWDEYEAFVDSLKEERKKNATKCIIRYTSENNIPAWIRDYGDSVIADPFTAEYFRDISPKTIIDTISCPMALPDKGWSMQYLEIVPHHGSRFDGGGSVFNLSHAYFTADGTMAILYYDYVCGGKCGRGNILFVEWTSQGWQIVKIKELWVS